MNSHLKQLIDLSKIDKQIDDFEPQIDSANARYKASLTKSNIISSDIEKLETEIKNEQLKKSKNELHLEDIALKLEENIKKSSEIKTEREMKSLQLEEEIAKEQITFANEEIERVEKIIEAKTEEVQTAKTILEEQETLLAKVKESVDSDLEKLVSLRKELFLNKETLLGKTSSKGLAFYQKIRRWAKNTTVVAIEDSACTGCNMLIADKLLGDVIRAEEINTCSHCGRILFMEAIQSQE